MFKLHWERAEEPEIKSPTSIGSQKKQETSRKTPTSASLTIPKPLTVWTTTNCGKFFKRWEPEVPDHLTCLLRNLCVGQEATVRTRHESTDWCQTGKGVLKDCILSACLFNFFAEYIMRHARLDEAQLESRLPGEISITSDMQMTPPLWQTKRNERGSWWKWKRRVEKAGLKLNIQKTKIMASGPIPSWQREGKTVETVTKFIFWAPESLQTVSAAMELKDACSLEGKIRPT